MIKKLFFLVVALVSLTAASYAATDSYTVNDDAIEAVFAQAAELSTADIDNTIINNVAMPTGQQSQATVQAKSAWGAFAICFLIGEFGIHRHYMGTKKGMWAIYTFTCGGIFGLVPIVDMIVLLVGAIKDDISAYENNNKFFMWL